jgi:hypothetical protein
MVHRQIPKLSQVQIADAWAKFAIKIWREKINKLNIGDSEDLFMSFHHSVVGAANGVIIKIEFAFRHYGKFVDMGVGKGVKIGQVKEQTLSRKLEVKMIGNRRRPKKWYSKTFAAETMKLVEILFKEYAYKGVTTIIDNIQDNSLAWGSTNKS